MKPGGATEDWNRGVERDMKKVIQTDARKVGPKAIFLAGRKGLTLDCLVALKSAEVRHGMRPMQSSKNSRLISATSEMMQTV